MSSELSESEDVEVTPELIQRYDRPGPRYTSYPAAPAWREDFKDGEYRAALQRASERPNEPLSLYVHLPFCRERCSFCGCNVIISRKESVVDIYLDHIEREIEMVSAAIAPRRIVKQIHWGGGTPTYLNIDQLHRLFSAIASRFDIDPGAEIALEMDPRVTSREQVETLRALGFNRVSMGVQDLDPNVQCAIHREQTEEQTRRLFAWCREAGFEGINIDLIYGLPEQRLEGWTETIRKVIDIGPDRLAVYSYAHLPDKLHHQRKIDAAALPQAALKLELFTTARRMFINAGYRAIGMDHFALPGDELSIAMDERRLYRNFMGYAVVPATDMIGFGTSAIGEVGAAYAQNEKKLSRYYQALDEGRFATASGRALTEDDQIRKWVILQLMCNFYLDMSELRRKFGVDFNQYFADETIALEPLIEEGFLVRDDAGLLVLPLGRVFIRNIAMVFDAYLNRGQTPVQFSRTV